MNQLEIDWEGLMKLLTSFYFPNRSGIQEGYDAYSRFDFAGKSFFWKFECKELNSNHKNNWSNLQEVETVDFANKVLQLMGRRDRQVYPHVFCVIIPHKNIGRNNILRDDLKSWNIFNKFPFKIVIWDFDFLGQLLPDINSTHADSIYPNAPSKNKTNHDGILKKLRSKIENESVDGFFHNRSYIRERNIKDSAWDDNTLHIKVDKIPKRNASDNDRVIFKLKGLDYSCYEYQTRGFSVNTFSETAYAQDPPSVPIASTESEIRTIEIDPVIPTRPKIDEEKYNTFVEEQKSKLIELFKICRSNSKLYKFIPFGFDSLFKQISAFCHKHREGYIVFYLPRELNFAELPIKELSSTDFDKSSNITFYMRFEGEEL